MWPKIKLEENNVSPSKGFEYVFMFISTKAFGSGFLGDYDDSRPTGFDIFMVALGLVEGKKIPERP